MPPDSAPTGEEAHLRALEALYASAPVNQLFASQLTLPEAGRSEIRFTVASDTFHAAGAAHGTLYFKMLDDAAFYAANGLVSDRFLLTTAFNLHFTKPMRDGTAVAEGRWVSGRRRVFVGGLPHTLRVHGTLSWLRGQRETAETLWSRSRDEALRLGATVDAAFASLEMGRRLRRQEDVETAVGLFRAMSAEGYERLAVRSSS